MIPSRYDLQKARIIDIAGKLKPGCLIQFDPDARPDSIRFLIMSPDGGVVLVSSSGHISIDELETMSDAEIERRLKLLSAGRL